VFGRVELKELVYKAVVAHGGRASLVQVAEFIWKHAEHDLKAAGDLFYTWQYDMRWAATRLREEGLLKPADVSPRGLWEAATR
jgi:hypothetical protein